VLKPQRLNANLGTKIGALLLAVLLWLHAATEHTYEKEIELALLAEEPSNESGGLMWARMPPDKVRVLVSGIGKDLLRFVPEAYVLRVKLTDEIIAKGGGHYPLDPTMVEYRGVGTKRHETKITSIVSPKKIEVELDRRVEREVRVSPRIQVEVAESFVLVGGIAIKPEKIRLSGPERYISELEEIQTEELVFTDLKEDVLRRVGFILPPEKRLSIDVRDVQLSLDIQELAEYEITNIPIRVLNATSGVAPEPSRVKVRLRGGADIIGALSNTKDIELYVDYLEWSPGGRLEVRGNTHNRFEIRDITPQYITLFER
jgi:YbbR domain-containing protein